MCRKKILGKNIRHYALFGLWPVLTEGVKTFNVRQSSLDPPILKMPRTMFGAFPKTIRARDTGSIFNKFEVWKD